MDQPNSDSIEAWNTILFDKFVRFRHLLVDGLSRHSEAAMERNPYPSGAKVLDVGCGFGDCTQCIARMVGPSGMAVGMDCAENFVRTAAAEARGNGLENTSFRVGDAQWGELQGPYDHAFSRFGTMFFDMPGAAMRNIRKALQPGGTFTQIVWRKREDNPWLHEAELRVRSIVPVVSHEESGAVHCGPGPFSMANADMLSSMLDAAGFDRIRLERHDCDICIGRDLEDAIAFAMAIGPAGEIIRLAGEEGVARTGEVVEGLRDTLAPYMRDDGVWAPSSTWIVSAASP